MVDPLNMQDGDGAGPGNPNAVADHPADLNRASFKTIIDRRGD
jgi:hypothetical protein